MAHVREHGAVERVDEQEIRKSDDEREIEERAQRERHAASSPGGLTRNSRVICRRQRTTSAYDLYHPPRSLYPGRHAG